MSLTEKISESEFEVMKILWREVQPVPFADIRTELNEKMGWKKSTIATLLRRLQDKGVVLAKEKQEITHKEKRIHYYTPNITKSEYIKAKEKSMIDKLYEGSAKNLAVALCHRGELTEADIDELKSYFQMGGTDE